MQLNKQLQKPGVIAFLLGFFTLVLLILTAPSIGLTWDEPAYIAAARSYQGWFREFLANPSEAFEQEVIDQYWAVNHEHPPMDKVWSGFVWEGARHVFDDLVAHRLGNMILVSVMVAMIYLWVEKAYGWIAGLTAAAALMALPRFFFHAHLAALDVPAAFAVFTMTFCFIQWLDRPSWKWTFALGLVFSVAFATKINTFFVPPTLFLWALIFQRRWYLFIRLGVASLMGLGGAVLLWPWLYPDILARIEDYILFITVDHWEIGQWYFGQFYMPPPWHFPFVILWAVVPLTVTFLYLTGIIRALRDRKRDGGLGMLFILSALVPILALSIGQSMVYDNDRLFMPTFPFLAALAGIGFAWLVAGIHKRVDHDRKPWLNPALSAGLALIVFLPPLVSAVDLYPHLLSYYARSVGGLPGATRLELESTYWCETYAEALPYINENAAHGDMVWVEPWSHDVLLYYQLEGKLRSDLRIAAAEYASSILGPADTLEPGYPWYSADYIIFQHRQTYYGGITDPNPITPEWWEGQTPAYRLAYQGVPLLSIFEGK
jgi:4-amino-4-deoxy-L-arabinose transferase-like glycosyltransferase